MSVGIRASKWQNRATSVHGTGVVGCIKWMCGKASEV